MEVKLTAPPEDKKALSDAAKQLKSSWAYFEKEQLIPDEEIRASHRRENLLWHYGIRKWHEFFSQRQLLVMLTLLKNIKQICEEIEDKEYAKAIALYLSFLLGKHVYYNSLGTTWHTSVQAIAHALTFRRPSMTFNHAETNPFEKTSGSLITNLVDILDGLRFLALSNKPCKVFFGSVMNPPLQAKFDLILTDPPYADDVQYAELSELFYVWLYRALGKFFPEIPSRVPLDDDISVSWGRFGKLDVAKDFYEKAMTLAFKRVNTLLKEDGLLVVFFAHSSTEAWDLLLRVLRESKLKVTSSYAIHTESTNNVIAKDKTSFMSSIVVSCRKVGSETSAYFEDLLPTIEDKVKKMLNDIGTEDLLELPITDLLIMTYGKVLEEATQHSLLKSYRADFKPEFEVLIRDAREFILKQIVAKLTGRSPNALGSEMSFYIVTKVFFGGMIESSEALKISWAYQVNIDDLEKKQVVKKVDGITRLMFFDEVFVAKKAEEIDRNNLHQQLLYLEEMTDKQGISGVKRALQFSNFKVEDLKQIVALLIKSYRMRTNKGDSLEPREEKELKILEILADLFGSPIRTGGGSLDKFM